MPKFERQHSLQKLFPKPRLLVSSDTSSVLLMLESENGSEIQPRVMCVHMSISDLKKYGLYRPSTSISSFDECSKLMLRYYTLPDVCLSFCGDPGQKELFGLFPTFAEGSSSEVVFQKGDFFLHSCECVEG